MQCRRHQWRTEAAAIFDKADDAEPDAETASDSLTDIMLRYRPGAHDAPDR